MFLTFVIPTCFLFLLSVFFSDRLAAEGSSGTEVLVGTPLRMPANPDFKSFAKMITQVLLFFSPYMWWLRCCSLFVSVYTVQLPDADAPYIFSLPDNIERSLQRTNSTALIKQLRVLSSSDAEATKYDREKWRAQVQTSLMLSYVLSM